MTAFICSIKVAVNFPQSQTVIMKNISACVYITILENMMGMLKALTAQMPVLPNYSSLCINIKPILPGCNLKI